MVLWVVVLQLVYQSLIVKMVPMAGFELVVKIHLNSLLNLFFFTDNSFFFRFFLFFLGVVAGAMVLIFVLIETV